MVKSRRGYPAKCVPIGIRQDAGAAISVSVDMLQLDSIQRAAVSLSGEKIAKLAERAAS
jgi:hypothetical protein